MKRVSVIGAGFSSLSATCYLAKHGFEAEKFEKNSTIGGRARQYMDAGFILAEDLHLQLSCTIFYNISL